MVLLVILTVSSALLVGSIWGLFGHLPERVEGFLIAMAGGALVMALGHILIGPAIKAASLTMAALGVVIGAIVFTTVDYLIDEKWGDGSGGGLLAAITLDGIPENMALGVALIGAEPAEVIALAGAIFLSNLPESAGGSRDMAKSGRAKEQILLLWVSTAVLLSIAAMSGRYLLAGVTVHWLAFIRCFAAGAVVASLATEVFPKAYREGRHLAGIATALGLVLAFVLARVGGA